MTSCPRCGEGVAAGQEYCLECGLRLPGASRLGAAPADPRRLALPLVLAAVVAAGGAAVAIALTRETATATPIVTATGGSEVVPTPTVADVTRLAQWPAGTSGWTNILVSVPKVTVATPPWPAPTRRARGACEASACSTPPATRAFTRVTGWCSPASTRASPRRRAACARQGRAERRPHRSASAGDFVVHIDNFGAEVCNTEPNRVHSAWTRALPPCYRLLTAFLGK